MSLLHGNFKHSLILSNEKKTIVVLSGHILYYW